MDSEERAPTIADIQKRLLRTRGCDRGRLNRRLSRLKASKTGPEDGELRALLEEVLQSAAERQRRSEHPPRLRYPEDLPITDHRDRIIEAIKGHQVVVLSGETGSGKTTQIPKMCIEAGRGIDGLIGCTQPRRIAALTVSARIAEELGDERYVGSKIRFHDSTGPENVVRVMTDGMLLAEAQGHPTLRAYDTLIIDEAHERSLNIDVLLGLVRRLVDRRKDLKVIITSATLDTAKFSRHFADAPIIEVSGRTYPVEIRYADPGEGDGNASAAERCAQGVLDILEETRRGDILVFLPTEQDIRDTIDIVARSVSGRLDLVPLYARLPAREQKRAFALGGARKVVVATNVAETSLTIPGIKYVVDSGLARISRYNPGTGTQGLPVEPISQASADQRAGRCGRVEDGICIRLYSEEDYAARGRYTPPEIRRTNLAEVILRMLDLGITDIEGFPFVDPPPRSGIRDGLRTLREIGALRGNSRKPSGGEPRLSRDGRLMARLPLDPRLARVLIQADREACLGDVLPIVAALSLPDPRERPKEKKGSADAVHRAFQDPQSDFIGWLNLWDAFRKDRGRGSYSGRLKRFCTDNYLSFRRMREWMDIHRQLTLVMEDAGYRPRRRPAEASLDTRGRPTERYTAIHRSVLSGFLSHIARREEGGSYEATRNRSAWIHPGSAVRKTAPDWIIAAELVKTSRLFARSLAAIEPEWLLDLGGELIKTTWTRPHWSRRNGDVRATEQCRLFGFLISDDNVVPYGPRRPQDARRIFIRSALVEGDLSDGVSFGFLEANRHTLERLRTAEDKLRRRQLVAGDDAVEEFYSDRLPESVLDIGTLQRFVRDNGDDGLRLQDEDVLIDREAGVSPELFPDEVEMNGYRWSLGYVFDSESPEDGITLKVPSGRLSELDPRTTDWIVPGRLPEMVEALLRSLPKTYRKRLIPIPETATAALDAMAPGETDLVHALAAWVYRERGIDIPMEAWKPEELPPHLRIRYSLEDDSGREIAAGRNPADLRPAGSSGADQGRLRRYRREHEIAGLTAWPENGVPEALAVDGGAMLWPALCDETNSVALRFLDDRLEAEERQRAGQCRLARIHWSREIRDMRRLHHVSGRARVNAVYLGGAGELEDRLWNRVIRDVFAEPFCRSAEQWSAHLAEGGRRLDPTAAAYVERLSGILLALGEARAALDDLESASHRKEFVADRRIDLDDLIPADFLETWSETAFNAAPRWIAGIVVRTRKGIDDPKKEQRAAEDWNPLNDRLERMIRDLSPLASPEKRAALDEAALMIQELRIAVFAAGELRTAGKISASRMEKKLDEIARML